MMQETDYDLDGLGFVTVHSPPVAMSEYYRPFINVNLYEGVDVSTISDFIDKHCTVRRSHVYEGREYCARFRLDKDICNQIFHEIGMNRKTDLPCSIHFATNNPELKSFINLLLISKEI